MFVGCMNDIRYNDEWLPMDHSQNEESRAADLTQSDNLEDGCHSEACLYGVHCRVPLICYDLWRYAECGSVTHLFNTPSYMSIYL